MNRKIVGALASLPFLLASAPAAAAPASPDPGSVTLKVLGVNGSGCPRGTVTPVVADDGSSVRFDFTVMQATLEPLKIGACTAILEVQHDAGWTYGLRRAVAVGTADVPAGTRGRIGVQSWHQGQSETAAASREVTELSGPWSFADDLNVVYGDCSSKRGLVVQLTLGVAKADSGRAAANARLSSSSATVSTSDLAWKKCD